MDVAPKSISIPTWQVDSVTPSTEVSRLTVWNNELQLKVMTKLGQLFIDGPLCLACPNLRSIQIEFG